MNKTVILALQIMMLAAAHSCRPAPDKPAFPAMVTGRVTALGESLEGVVVTDGRHCALTDGQGRYSLLTDENFVYVSTPKGYVPRCESTVPCFYLEIERGRCSGYDFSLLPNPKDDTRHIFLVEADVQCGSAAHWELYSEVYSDYREFVSQNYSGADVFGVNCGDIGWDNCREFYPYYMSVVADMDIPVYRCIGNHDMDYSERTHEHSHATFEKCFGPDHFSFTRGDAHYVFLNNCFYIGREYFYMGYLDEKTLSWLQEDLSYVKEGSLLFIICHIPMRLSDERAVFGYTQQSWSDQTVNSDALLRIINSYDAHIISGHMHWNRNNSYAPNIVEHNTASMCGIWWEGELCLDGSPRGYGVYEVDGSDVKWFYKSAGYDPSYQFRACPAGSVADFPQDFVVNVWNHDREWKVEWLENGVLMGPMLPFEGIDPAVRELCDARAGQMPSWIQPCPTKHLFRASPVNPQAEIDIKVTDRFGNVYTQPL